MASNNPPRLQVAGLSGASAEEQSATASPARGAEMTNFLRSRLMGRRGTQQQSNLNPNASPPSATAPQSPPEPEEVAAPPLIHSWCFWHDRQDRSTSNTAAPPSTTTHQQNPYESRLDLFAEISDVRQFWSVLNNFDVARLPLRDSVHLFHKGVKPIWEDPRNARGGAWTFRVPLHNAAAFWLEVCMLAIGEQLQAAVDDPTKMSFRDDICGVSLSMRTQAVLVQVWNRDGGNEEGIRRIRETVEVGLREELRLREDRLVYYKRHAEHNGFGKTATGEVRGAGS